MIFYEGFMIKMYHCQAEEFLKINQSDLKFLLHMRIKPQNNIGTRRPNGNSVAIFCLNECQISVTGRPNMYAKFLLMSLLE